MNGSVRRLLALAGAAGALLAPTSAALAQGDEDRFLSGTEAFRYVLQLNHFNPVPSPEALSQSPQGQIIIVLGEVAVLDNLNVRLHGLRQWVENGGALLVATDRPVPDARRRACEQFGLEIAEQPVLLPRQVPDSERFRYRGLEECPFVQPYPGKGSPLFEGLTPGVATNRAGWVRYPWRPRGQPLSALAVFPPGSEWHGSRDGPILGLYPFAVGGDLGAGRVLFLADHSVFINSMMLQPDNGNFQFAERCLDWLSNGDGEVKRKEVLLYDEGNLVTTFNVPLQDVPFPSIKDIPDPILAADQLIAGLEREDMFNRLLFDHVTPGQLLRALSVLLTAALACYGLTRLLRARHRIETAAPLLEPALERLAPAGTVLEQRHQALLAHGNLGEPARELARGFFRVALGTSALDGDVPPGLHADAGWLQRRAIRQQVERLWQLAQAAEPLRVSAGEFAKLAGQVRELRAALEEGRLRLG